MLRIVGCYYMRMSRVTKGSKVANNAFSRYTSAKLQVMALTSRGRFKPSWWYHKACLCKGGVPWGGNYTRRFEVFPSSFGISRKLGAMNVGQDPDFLETSRNQGATLRDILDPEA